MKMTKRQYALYLFNVLVGLVGGMFLSKLLAWLVIGVLLLVVIYCLKSSTKGAESA